MIVVHRSFTISIFILKVKVRRILDFEFLFSSLGILLPELISCLLLLQTKRPIVLQLANVEMLLHSLLDHLDKFNHCSPGLAKDESEDLTWPGVWGELVSLSFNLLMNNNYFC